MAIPPLFYLLCSYYSACVLLIRLVHIYIMSVRTIILVIVKPQGLASSFILYKILVQEWNALAHTIFIKTEIAFLKSAI